MAPSKRKRRNEEETAEGGEEDKDAMISSMRNRVSILRREIANLREDQETYYSSKDCAIENKEFPEYGSPASHVKEAIIQNHELDSRPRLNTSSYVNVVSEPEERDVAMLGMEVNLADGSVYPASVRLHDVVVNMIAELWNCPKPENEENYSGAGTVGSTEACLLAGLAHKFRWRKWYAEKHGLNKQQIIGVVPNIVISSCYQAAWEKLFRYFDVVPRFIFPKLSNQMRIDPAEIEALVDENTIMVVGILGNHYNGAYDPIWDMDQTVSKINKEKGYQVGIHVDAASGGFIAPFQEDVPPFDFRLDNVLSISASGHKFGESVCGTGWLVFRHRENLAEHISVSVTYLGGVSDSITLNFSRPAAGPYVQLYKFLRLGKFGYQRKVTRQLEVTKKFRDLVRAMEWDNQPLFEICDADTDPCLPVFAARLNPKLKLSFDDHRIQHAISEFHWYVGAYSLSFEDFSKDGKLGPLLADEPATASMFRVVFKSNLTHSLAADLFGRLKEVVDHLHAEESNNGLKMAVLRKYAAAFKNKGRHLSLHKAC